MGVATVLGLCFVVALAYRYEGCSKSKHAVHNATLIGMGVQKSGTTSLYTTLQALKTFNFGAKKEHHFFEHRSCEAFPAYMATAYGDRPHQILADITPIYLASKHAITRICACFYRVKLLVLLRDPTARALSGFWQELPSPTRRKDRERMMTEFVTASIQSKASPMGPINPVSRGFYQDQLEYLFRYFPVENVFIYQSEMLYADPATFFERFGAFLGIPLVQRVLTPVPRGPGRSTGASRRARESPRKKP